MAGTFLKAIRDYKSPFGFKAYESESAGPDSEGSPRLGAYAQLPAATNDERYHAAVLHAQVGRVTEALALADTMLQATPGYLLAYVVRGDIAEIQGDSARLRAAYADFQAAFDREIEAARGEYADHRNVLDEFLQRARAAS